MIAPRPLLCIIIVLSGLVSRIIAADQEPQRFSPDRNLFKGRLIGVAFTPVDPSAPPAIRLQFFVEQPYAMFPQDGDSPTVAGVLTDWKVDESKLGGINGENYTQSVESMFPDDIHLGDSYLVTAHWPSNKGYEVLAIIPASKDSEAVFLKENREYVLKYREHWHRAKVQVHSVKLQTLRAKHHAHLIEIENHQGKDLEFAQQNLKAIAEQWQGQRDWSIQEIEKLTKPLHDRLKEALQPDERRSIQQMIETSEIEIGKLREAKLGNE